MSAPRQLIKLIQANLSDDLLKPFWRREKQAVRRPDPTFGHCYLASEALYYLWGKQNGYKPYKGGTHWFLKKGGDIVDPTAEQFKGAVIYEHNTAKGCAFLTKEPSKRCQILMARLALSTAVKKGMISTLAVPDGGATRILIYQTLPHSSELVLELKLSGNTASISYPLHSYWPMSRVSRARS